MDRIRLLARVMFWAGWVSLGLGVLMTVGSLLALPPQGIMSSQPALMMAGSSIYGAMFSLGLFFGWGTLTVLCEISEQLDELLRRANQ